MTDDSFGRPTEPVCGQTTHGLFFRRDHEWGDVPERQRCVLCERSAQVVEASNR